MPLTNFFLSRSKSVTSKKDGIVVKLHGLVLSGDGKKLVQREPFVCDQEHITAENLEHEVLKHLEISNFASSLFGLCRFEQQHCDWILPSTVIKSGEVLCFSLRLPLADQARLSNLAKHCEKALDYIYGQVREGFVNKQWNLGSISTGDYANIIKMDIRYHAYMLKLKPADVRRVLDFDCFAGPCYNKTLTLDKATMKEHCLSKCKEYFQNEAEKSAKGISKEIRNCKYQYITDILKHATNFGSKYKCLDETSLKIESKIQEKGCQGLRIISKDEKPTRSIAVLDICKVDVVGKELQVVSFDTSGEFKKEEFSMCREEDATSVGLLLNLLYKLSVNYMTDMWLESQKHSDMLFQKNLCYPPARFRWVKERLGAIQKIDERCKFIISEVFSEHGKLRVAYFDSQKSATFTELTLERSEEEDVWRVEGQDKTLRLEEIVKYVAELLGCKADGIIPVPLLLPYNDLIYHCRESEQTVHQPVVLNQYTISNSISGNENASIYAAKVNFRKTNKSKADDVAIKKLENPQLHKFFTDMICQMTHWKHKNLICLHGVSVANGIGAIIDYFPDGNLRDFMNYERQGQILKILHLAKITEQLLRALIYLQEKITYVEKEPGDLSSYHGNIKMSKLMLDLFSEDDIVIKLGDPGLHSVASPMWLDNPAVLKRLPWCAPELMSGQGMLTSFTDIYALGVTMWEIWSAGLLPYKEINKRTRIEDSDKVKLIVNYVKSGGHLTKPHWASNALYEMMKDCWESVPVSRPSVQTLQRNFHTLLSSETVDLNQVCDQTGQEEPTIYDEKMNWDSVEEMPDEVMQNIANSQEAAAAAAAAAAADQSQTVHPVLTGLSALEEDGVKHGKFISSLNIKVHEDKVLGKGAFGTVKEGLLNYADPTQAKKVAVKACLSENDENAKSLKEEIRLMRRLKHENVVTIEGFYLDKGAWHLVMEFMDGGSLRAYLKMKGAATSILATLAQDAAKGMAYLSQENVIHKDLAARNVLLSGTKGSRLIAKISDFGLSRILQVGNVYKLTSTKTPWKWYPPEALAKAIFTAESDIWSYGCVVWETFDRCKNDLSLAEGKQAQVEHRKKLLAGERKGKPANCPQDVYDTIILKCWERESAKRPKFSEVVDLWSDLIQRNQDQW